MMGATDGHSWWQPVGFESQILKRLAATLLSWHVGWVMGVISSGARFSVGMLTPLMPVPDILGVIIVPGMAPALALLLGWCCIFVWKRMPYWTTLVTVIGAGVFTYGLRVMGRSG